MKKSGQIMKPRILFGYFHFNPDRFTVSSTEKTPDNYYIE